MAIKNGPYTYASERAVALKYNQKTYTQGESRSYKHLINNEFSSVENLVRPGLITGYINGRPIPLTSFIFLPANALDPTTQKKVKSDPVTKEITTMVHTDSEKIPPVMEHINELVQKGMDGDLSVIPHIHWWYVHLAPTYRGPSGTAEMLIHSICRAHDVTLPPWKDDIAPSMEVLLEPDEEQFCQNYHTLFANKQDELQAKFSSKSM